MFDSLSTLKCWFSLNAEYNVNNTCKDSTTELLAPSWTGMSIRLHAIFEYSPNERSIYSEGNATSENISSTYWGQTCINESMSGICFVYETVGGCLFLWTSPTEEIQDKICFGFFYACSIEWTFEYFPPIYCFLLFIIISSILALSDWFKQGSSWKININLRECSNQELLAVHQVWAFWEMHRLHQLQEYNQVWKLSTLYQCLLR